MQRICDSRNFKKTHFNSISLGFQKFNFQPPPVHFPPSKSQSKTQHLDTSTQIENHSFSTWHQYLDGPIVPKNFLISSFFRYLNSYPSKTTEFISWIRAGIETILVVENCSMRILSTCVPCFSVLTDQNFQEVLLFSESLTFQACIPQLLQVRTLPPRSHPNKKLRWNIEVQKRWFFALYQSPDSPKLPKKTSHKKFSRHSNSFSFFTLYYILHFSIHSLSDKLLIWKTIWMVILSISSLALEYWTSDFVKNANYIVPSRYWNS